MTAADLPPGSRDSKPKRKRLRAVALVGATLVVAGAGGLKISSSRDGETMLVHAMRTLLLPALNVKAAMESPEAYAQTIRKSRASGDAPPPDDFQDRYSVSRADLDGHRVYVVSRKGADSNANTTIYIHGGSYVGNMMSAQWHIVKELVERSDQRVVVPFYPLAPEHDWRDGYAMLEKLFRREAAGRPPSTVVLAGDSAGGGLALGLSMALRDAGGPLPGKIVLFSPWLNLQEHNPAQARLEDRDPMLARAGLVWAAKEWAGTTPLENPRISPIFGSLRGLPPIALFSGTADLLHADSLELVAKAKAEGTDMFYLEGRNMTHAWSVIPTSDADPMYDAMKRFLAK